MFSKNWGKKDLRVKRHKGKTERKRSFVKLESDMFFLRRHLFQRHEESSELWLSKQVRALSHPVGLSLSAPSLSLRSPPAFQCLLFLLFLPTLPPSLPLLPIPQSSFHFWKIRRWMKRAGRASTKTLALRKRRGRKQQQKKKILPPCPHLAHTHARAYAHTHTQWRYRRLQPPSSLSEQPSVHPPLPGLREQNDRPSRRHCVDGQQTFTGGREKKEKKKKRKTFSMSGNRHRLDLLIGPPFFGSS